MSMSWLHSHSWPPMLLMHALQAALLAEHDMSWVMFVPPEARQQAQQRATIAMSEYAIR